jgi:DNA-binding transcriptional ArsR family regulator
MKTCRSPQNTRKQYRLQSGNPGIGPIMRSKQAKMTDEIQVDPRKMASAAQKASELMKTLGHRDRLMVLCHLISGEKSVGELASLLEIPQSPLSQHLARMRKESLVSTRREAQTIYYSITSGEAGRIVALMHELYCSE